MASYTTSLRLIQPTTGEYSGTWGTQVNNGLTALVDNAVAGTATIAVGSTDYTLSIVNGAADEARSAVLNLTAGAGVGARNIICPAVSKLYVVVNATGFTQTVKTASGTGVAVPTGTTAFVRCNGTDVLTALNYFGSLTLGAALPISSGGTGSTSTAYCSLTANVTGTLPVANGGTGVTSSTGTGSVVLSTSPTLVTPVLGTPTSGTLTNCTGLPISTGVSGLGSGVATFLATPTSANLAAAVTNETGSGALVFATSPTLVTPALGTPTSGTLTSCTGLPISTGVSGLGTGVATALAVNTGSSGAFVVNGGALGTPSSGTATNLTGLPLTTGVTGTLPVANGGTGLTSLGAGVATFLGTPTSANLAAAVTDETGSGSLVFATSPTLVTPTLGVATATSINKLTITAPATSATLTIANSKTLTANSSLTFTGTDATTMTFPTTNATIARTDAAQTFTGTQTFSSDTLINSVTVGRGANSSDPDSTAVGRFALQSATTGGVANTAVGNFSLNATSTGDGNTAVGHASMLLNTTGSANTGVGNGALENSQSGDGNTAVGHQAGDLITTGTGNTIIGQASDPSSSAAINQIVVGLALTGKGDYTAFIGGAFGAYNGKNVTTWETISDARIKKNIVDNNAGLEVLKQIRVRNFEYRKPNEITQLPEHAAIQKDGVQLGVIAQELQQALPECVTENSTGVLSVNTDPLIWYLINAVKTLSAEIELLKQQ